MISLSQITEFIQNGLNNNTQNIVFNIIEEGKYKEAQRNSGTNNFTEYVNGSLSSVSSAIIPILGLNVATQQARLELVVSDLYAESESDLADRVETVRNIVQNFFQQNVVTVLTDSEGKNFSVNAYFSLLNSGTLSMRPTAGVSFTLLGEVNLSFIESGISSFTCPIYLDGVQIPYENALISRVPSINSVPYQDSNSATQGYTESTSLGVDLEVPSLSNNEAINNILNFIINADDSIHTLTVNFNGTSTDYNVIFGECNLALQGVLNGKHKVSFVEAREFNNGIQD